MGGIPARSLSRQIKTGERVKRDGLWHVYEFAVQLDAIQFWHRFDGDFAATSSSILMGRKACRRFELPSDKQSVSTP